MESSESLRGTMKECFTVPPVSRRPICLFVVVFSFISPPISCFQGKFANVCISPGGRFPPFKPEGKPPKRAERGPRGLTLCRVFRENTCCDAAQTIPAFASIRSLASAGEASQECLDLWEVLECSICHPHIGTTPGLPLICSSFCDKVFGACSNAYFSMDGKTLLLSPCGLNDVMCGRAREWVSNGTELCQFAGFSVQPASQSNNEAEEPFCYGNKASLEASNWFWKGNKPSDLVSEEDFLLWLKRLTIKEMLSWGTALGAGLFLLMRRKRPSYGRRQAAVQRTATMLRSRTVQG